MDAQQCLRLKLHQYEMDRRNKGGILQLFKAQIFPKISCETRSSPVWNRINK